MKNVVIPTWVNRLCRSRGYGSRSIEEKVFVMGKAHYSHINEQKHKSKNRSL